MASAEKIGMISNDVVEKIKGDKALSEALGTSFKKTFDNAKTAALTKMKDDTEKTAEDKEKIARAKAFREAFRMVYGRFMLEGNDDALDTIGKSSADLLKGILKFPIEDKDKLKGRSELKSAFSRLKAASESDTIGIKPKIKAKILAAEDEYAKARGKVASESAVLSSYSKAAEDFKTLKPLGLKFLEASGLSQLKNDVSKQEKLNNLFLDARDHYLKSEKQDYRATLAYVERKIALIAKDESFDSNVRNLCKVHLESYRNLHGDADALEEFYSDKLGDFLTKLEATVEEVGGISTDRMQLASEIEEKVSHLNDSFSEIDASNDENKAKSKKLCKDFLAKFKGSKNDRELLEFITAGFDVFVKEFEKILQQPKSNLEKVKEEEVKAKNELEAAKMVTFESWIINAAFPKKKSGAEMKRLERLHHEAEHKEHELQDVYKYFSSHDSFTNVVEGGSQLAVAIGDWKAEKDKGAKSLQNSLDAKEKEIGKESDPKKLEKLKEEKASLLKQKEKSGLGLNARIAYLDEQISLKKTSIRSSDSIERALNEMGKLKKDDFVREKEREIMENENEKKAEDLGALKDEHKRLTLIASKAKEFKDELTKLVIKSVKAEHLDIDIGKHIGGAHHANAEHGGHHGIAASISSKLQKINLDNGNFDPQDLINLYGEFHGLFGDSDRVQSLLADFDAASAEKSKATKDAKKELDKETAKSEKEKNFTDADAAKRIIGALVGEQFPDMSPMDHNKLVTMILAEDVATLQTDEGYAELAQRGTAEAMETAKFANVRKRLLNFKYKEGDKVVQPLKGIKPDDLKDWESIEKLFTFGKLNYKNAFFVLVAFQDFDGDVKSIQSVKLEKKLKTLLAKQMGVDAHMDKAGISKVVDDAFKAQMEKIKPIMKAHFSIVETKGGKAKENKKKVLDMKYEDLNDQFRSGKFSSEIYDHKLESLIKEAKEAEVDVEFSADSAGAKYWNSPYAQWLKDKLHDAGSFVGKKALAAGVFAPLKIAGKGVWGATKLGTALGFQTALLPVRAAKYPLLLAAKPLVGFINLFRANKWTPLPGLRDSVKNDTARIMGYAKEKASGVAKGTAETVTGTVSGEWGKVKYADTRYADRNKKKADERAELMKIHEPKSDLEAIEVPDSPFVDLAKYKKQIDMVATALGIKIDAPHGAEVKVGHEEKKDDHAKPHDAAHGAHDAHGEKKDDHAKPDAHAAKVDDHAKHDDHKKAA